jgi:uncharacterized protein YhfF
MKSQDKVQAYWDKFKITSGVEENDYIAWSFGDTKEMADNLATLVVKGIKTATTSSLDLYEPDEEKPFVGEYNIILDGEKNPVCITKTVVVEEVPFNLVSQEHAYHEGEGDRSLQQWRKDHEVFF